jgi:hypothetical protein
LLQKIHSLPNCSARRSSGGETIDLSYSDINHECGNIFICAPKQKTLMLADVVYPGYMSYKNLGIAKDVPGYMEAQKKALSFDFATFAGGHVTRLGDRSCRTF